MSVPVLDEFRRMPKSATHEEYNAIKVSARRDDFIVKGPSGEPIFLLRDSGATRYVIGRTLKHLKAEFHVTCAVKVGGNHLSAQFAMISCSAESPEFYEIFIRCVGASIEALPVTCDTGDLANIITELLETFRAMSQPAVGEISGLWAELWVILNSSDVARAVELWHSDIYDRFDFASTRMVAEVKSTTLNFRIHHFGLEQLREPFPGGGVVISLMLQTLSSGPGILELVSSVEADLGSRTDLKQKLWRIILRTLGADFVESVDRKYDEVFAARNMKVFAMTDVPSVENANDARVSDVSFRADLSSVSSSLRGNPKEILETCFVS